MPDLPRGKTIGTQIGGERANEAQHFMKCPACCGMIDCRDRTIDSAWRPAAAPSRDIRQ